MVTRWIAGALQGKDQFSGDHRIIRPDGEVAGVHSRAEVVRDPSGAPLRMRGTAHDITASKVAEEALARTTVRYRLLERMASAANEASTLAAVLQAAVDEICAHTGCPVGHAFLPSEEGVLESSGVWHLDQPERFEALRALTWASVRPTEPTSGSLKVTRGTA